MKLRVALVCDYLEEGWPSMDLVGAALANQLVTQPASALSAAVIRPRFVRRFSRAPGARALMADRLLNRFLDYPRTLRHRADDFDVFHIVDHSYSHLTGVLPSGSTVVTCHDLDAFGCLLEAQPRGRVLRPLARRVLRGLQRAAWITCVSETTRAELLRYGLADPGRLVTIPNGVEPIYTATPDDQAEAEATRLLGSTRAGQIDLLHVGSTIPRKRIEVLLGVFARVRRELADVRLIRVGGEFTRAQRALLQRLGLRDAVKVLPLLPRATLAALYRRAALLLLPSAAEGFGLPMVEAMASGTPVVASDLPVLHEVGGDAATFVPVGDLDAWTVAVVGLLCDRERDEARWNARREAARIRAARFSWSDHVTRLSVIYRRIAER